MGVANDAANGAEEKPSSSQKNSHQKAVGPDIQGTHQVFQLSKSLQTALFGGVYEARGLSSGGLYAVKVLHKSELKRATKHANQSDFCEIPLSELRFQSQMTGLPHVVEVVDSFEDEWCHYIVFPLAEGGDLLEALKKKPFGFAEQNAQHLIRMATQGLASLHERNLAMQDVSLENMLIFGNPATGHAQIKICDPGQAVLFERNKDTDCEVAVAWRGMVGKSFRPPELQKNRPYMATLVDAWCLGWSTFYLLVAQPLFMSADMSDNGWRQFQGGKDFAKLSHRKTSGSQRTQLSSKALDFVRRLMEIDPGRRMSVSEALMHPWLQDPGIAPILVRGELQLMDPAKHNTLQESYRGGGGGGGGANGVDVARGRSPSPKAPFPTPQGVQLRAWSPVLIPNLRVSWPVPRQGSPLNQSLSPGHGDSLSRGRLLNIDLRANARSLSPPPQIMIRPDFNSSSKQYAWTQVSHSPSPTPEGSRSNTPRKRAPMPIPVNGSKKDTSNGGNSGASVLGPTWAWSNNVRSNRMSGKGGQSQPKQTQGKHGALQRSLSPGLLSPIGFLKQHNNRHSSRLAWDPAVFGDDPGVSAPDGKTPGVGMALPTRSYRESSPLHHLSSPTHGVHKPSSPTHHHSPNHHHHHTQHHPSNQYSSPSTSHNHQSHHTYQPQHHTGGGGSSGGAAADHTRTWASSTGTPVNNARKKSGTQQHAGSAGGGINLENGTRMAAMVAGPSSSQHAQHRSDFPHLRAQQAHGGGGIPSNAASPLPPTWPPSIVRSSSPFSPLSPTLGFRGPNPIRGDPFLSWAQLHAPDTDQKLSSGHRTKGRGLDGVDRMDHGPGARGRALSPEYTGLKSLNASFAGTRLDMRTTRCLSPHPPNSMQAVGNTQNLLLRAMSPNPTPMGKRDLPMEKHHSNAGLKWNAQMH